MICNYNDIIGKMPLSLISLGRFLFRVKWHQDQSFGVKRFSYSKANFVRYCRKFQNWLLWNPKAILEVARNFCLTAFDKHTFALALKTNTIVKMGIFNCCDCHAFVNTADSMECRQTEILKTTLRHKYIFFSGKDTSFTITCIIGSMPFRFIGSHCILI